MLSLPYWRIIVRSLNLLKISGYVSTGIVAVFIYGLLNRSGEIGRDRFDSKSNYLLYLSESILFPEVHFLYSMSYSCRYSHLVCLWGLTSAEEKVEFTTQRQ